LTSSAKKFIKIRFLDLVLAVNSTPEPVIKRLMGFFIFKIVVPGRNGHAGRQEKKYGKEKSAAIH